MADPYDAEVKVHERRVSGEGKWTLVVLGRDNPGVSFNGLSGQKILEAGAGQVWYVIGITFPDENDENDDLHEFVVDPVTV